MKNIQENIILGQINVVPGRPDINQKKIIEIIENTKNWALIVFPEMAVSWYFLWDKWLSDSYIKELKEMNDDIVTATKDAWNSAIWWNIDYNIFRKNWDWSTRKYNAAYLASNWEIIWKRNKTLLPNYWKFDDKRYFTSLERVSLEWEKHISNFYEPFEIEINWTKQKVSILICEDIWNINDYYMVDPVAETMRYSPDIIAVPSASPFEADKTKFRKEVLEKASKNTTLAYVNPIWTQNTWKNIYIFDWESSIYENWEKIVWTKDYKEMNTHLTSPHLTSPKGEGQKTPSPSGEGWDEDIENKTEIEQIYDAIIFAIKNDFERLGFKKVVIGLSGWMDSGLVATLLVQAIWKENVIAINMPSKYNSDTTKNLAETLASNLEIEYKIYPIQDEVNIKIDKLEKITWEKPSDFEIENIQARLRWQILSDISPRYKAIFTSNWNKDELSTGYATLYWDTSGAISIIWDLHKTQVFDLARFINKKSSPQPSPQGEGVEQKGFPIPVEMIEMKPSAELSDGQNIDNSGWDPFDYEFLGKLKRAYIERNLTPEDILRKFKDWILEKKLGLDKNILDYFETKQDFIEEVEKLWKLKHNNFFKRIQYPPILTLTSSAFWTNYRESQNWTYFGKNYEKVKKEILEN